MSAPKEFHIAYTSRASVLHPSEGLNVLLSDLIKPLTDDGVQVTVHTTDRHHQSLQAALRANGVRESQATVKAHRVGSVLLNVLGRTKRGKPKRRGLWSPVAVVTRTARATVYGMGKVVGWLFDMTSLSSVYKIPLLLTLATLAVVVGLMLAPVVLAGALVAAFILVFVRAVLKTLRGLRARPFRGRATLRLLARRAFKLRRGLREDLYRREQIRLAEAINKQRRAQFVFVPWSFDGALIARLRPKTIVVFPDAVTTLFPLRFPGEGWQALLDGIKLALSHADGIVCYSNFVRDVQLPRFLSNRAVPPSVAVIPQGYFPLPDHPIARAEAVQRLNGERVRAVNLFRDLMAAPVTPEFDSFRYILYPTIDRPHKNVVVILRALQILIREKYQNVKLVLTTPALTSDAHTYIHDERLHRDVIVMPSVPIGVLDDLFAAASVMVHSSLAEGGDIFNFSRAVSQNCPALLSDIPVVREMFDRDAIPEEVFRDWLFDPMDSRVLAQHIERALMDKNGLLASQQSTLRVLGQYDFAAMAKRYFQFCEGFVK